MLVTRIEGLGFVDFSTFASLWETWVYDGSFMPFQPTSFVKLNWLYVLASATFASGGEQILSPTPTEVKGGRRLEQITLAIHPSQCKTSVITDNVPLQSLLAGV